MLLRHVKRLWLIIYILFCVLISERSGVEREWSGVKCGLSGILGLFVCVKLDGSSMSVRP